MKGKCKYLIDIECTLNEIPCAYAIHGNEEDLSLCEDFEESEE